MAELKSWARKMKLSLQEALDRVAAADLPSFTDRTIDSVHTRASCGDQPLHIAAIWGDTEMIEAFLDAGADIDSEGEELFTPLHCAIEQEKIAAAKLLIARGANLQKKESTFGKSAFDFITESKSPQIRSLLK
jgi:uncharacterized protein